MQAESSKLKATRGNIPDLYFQLRLQRAAHLIHENRSIKNSKIRIADRNTSAGLIKFSRIQTAGTGLGLEP